MPEPVSAWRGPGPGRPELPLPPERMPAWRGGRPLKRWTWVGAFGPELMLCAAVARIGPATAAWWAVWDRAAQRFDAALAAARRRARGDAVARARAGRDGARGRRRGAGRGRLAARRAVHLDAQARRRARARASCARPRGRRCRARRRVGRLPRAAHGVAVVGGRGDAGDAASRWRGTWSTACTTRPSRSERTVWVDGRAARGGRRSASTGSRASAGCASPRRRRARGASNLVLMSLRLRAAVRDLHGHAAGAGELREGWGVMERHAVAW